MKLKRLEILGFKSFPEKTNIEFCDGITSVVGPNGSGKSNILEAIRWVMGEQRTKSLRCKKMEDVIFNGSESLKPVGMAEVRLTLANDGRSFPHPMSDYDEIMIARRLFRDGNSQYEFNNVPCRLTDIIEFFLDTGIGRNSYAIIEQGRVEQIIAAKPEERRIFLEEAASVNRYKARRESAIKKLEQTNQNLQRIKDVVSEVKKQSQSLKKQAVKAERFRELRYRIRDLEIDLEAFKCQGLLVKLNRLKSDQAGLQDDLAAKESNLGKLSARLENIRVESSDVQNAYNDISEKLRSTEVDLNSVESTFRNCSTHETELIEKRRRIKSELDSLSEKKSIAKKSLEKAYLTLAELNADQSHLAESLMASQSSIERLEKQSKEETKKLDHFKDQLFEALQSLAQSKNRADQVVKRKTEFETRLHKDKQDLNYQTKSLEESLKQIELMQARNLDIEKSLNSIESKIIADRERRSGLIPDVKSLKENLRKLEKDFLSIKARIEWLNEQNRNYSAYGSGTQTVMKTFSSRQDESALIPLAEILETSPKYYQALTSVLESRLGGIIVSDFDKALELAEKIKELQISRVVLMPMDSFQHEESNQSSFNGEHTVKLSECVVLPEEFRGLLNHLLDDFYVVDDLFQAVELTRNSKVRSNFVTLAGEIIVPRRQISVGSLETPEKDILTMKSEYESLLVQASKLEQEIQDLNSILETKESFLQELSSGIEKLEQSRSDFKIQQMGLRKDIERLDFEISRSRSRIRTIELDRKRTVEEIDQLEKEDNDLKINLRSLNEEKNLLTKEKEAFEDHANQVRTLLDAERKQLNEIRIQLIQTEERKKSSEKDLNATQSFINNYENQTSNLKQESDYLSQQVLLLSEEKAKILNRKKELSGILQDFRVEQAKLHDSFNALKIIGSDLSEQVQALTQSVRHLRDRIHQNEVELARLEETLRSAVEKTQEKHQIDPRQVKCPTIQPDEAVLAEMRSKIESMGAVNLAAISESEQVEERLSFLLEQEKDLKAAVRSLFSTIEKIDRTTTQRFQATFQEVNAKFREIFSSLFNGGEAWLELIGSEDSPDHGVNIMVKPPGKRLQNVELLSGGEKALTAIAFIFAIFLYKPSSFCLLDEVDAPLDDSNVDRFNQMLRDLSRNTQFVIITHNKRSMEGADCLFGVTSEETGASALVSVKFSE